MKMNLTPVTSNKTSPFCSGNGISKSLLTPCRQVGLSRKRKTPCSVSRTASEDLLDTSETPRVLDTTPVIHKKSVPKRKSDIFCASARVPSIEVLSSENVEQPKTDSRVKVKKKVSKKLTMEPEKQIKGNSVDTVEVSCKEVSKTVRAREECAVQIIDGFHGFEKVVKPVLEEDRELVKTNSVNNKPLEPELQQKCKKIKRTLSIKKSSTPADFSDDDFAESPPAILKPVHDITLCQVELHRLDEPVEPSHPVAEAIITIPDDDDDENAFTSTPESSRTNRNHLTQEINKLDSQLKKNNEKLIKLKQAVVYRKRHNIDDLKNLTNTWRNGCVQGLHDLLAQLQTNGPKDMSTLLDELKVPPEMVAKLAVK